MKGQKENGTATVISFTGLPQPSNSLQPSREQAAIQKSARAAGMPSSLAEKYAQKLLKASPPSSLHSDDSPSSVADDFRVGDRVLVGGVKPGIVVFIGEVHFSPGDWAGVVLDSPTGKNDGTVGGHRYFMCEPMRGVFCRLSKLTKLPGGAASVAPTDPGSAVRPEKSDSLDPYRSRSLSPKVAVSKPSAVVIEKPSTPCQSTGSRHSDRGHPSPSAQAPSTNHSGGDDHVIARFKAGDRVLVSGSRLGTLRYLDVTDFAGGLWAGVELDEPVGKNDGCVAGTRYFTCVPMHGLFVPIQKLSTPESGVVASDVRLSSPHEAASERSSDGYRQHDNPRARGENLRVQMPTGSEVTTLPVGRIMPVNNKGETFQPKVDSGNAAVDNDEISLRLKMFVEKLDAEKTDLENKLCKEQQKVEDLQFLLEEMSIEKAHAETQLDKETQLRQELEDRLSKESSLTDRLSKEVAAAKGTGGSSQYEDPVDEYLDQIDELTHKLSVAEGKLKLLQSGRKSDSEAGLCSRCRQSTASEPGSTDSKQAAIDDDTARLKASLEKSRTECEAVVMQLDEVKRDLNKLTADKQLVEKQKADAVSQCQRSTAEQDEAVQRNIFLQSKLKEAEINLKELGQNVEHIQSAHTAQVAKLRANIDSLQMENNSLMAQQHELLPYKQKVEELTLQLQSVHNECEIRTAQVAELETALQGHHQLVEQHEVCKAQVVDMRNQLSSMMSDVNAEKVKLTGIMESMEKMLTEKDGEIHGLKSKLAELQDRVKAADKEDEVAKLRAERAEAESQVQFLNAVIAGIQRRNMELEAWRQAVGSTDGVNGHLINSVGPSLRLYCDICDVHDAHDTEDCPKQEM